MTLYLIAHKVRGEAAFDVAIKLPCPVCQHGAEIADESLGGCDSCDGLSVWWIIPTSGHRAFPYRYWHLEDLFDSSDYPHDRPWTHDTLPDPWPDHYAVNNPEHKAIAELDASSILSRLGLTRKPVEIKRRF